MCVGRAIPVAVSGHPVVLVDRHLLYLLYASLRIGSFGRFRTGMRGLSFPVDSPLNRSQKAADRCLVGGPFPWAERRGGLHRLY
jgi:hypothetical protein